MPINACVMYTGGKDSCYSLHWAIYHGLEVKCLLSIRASGWESRLFHYPGHQLLELHSKALGLPLISIEAPSVDEHEELNTLIKLFSKAKNLYGVKLVISGALLSDYQRLLFSIAAERLGLGVLTPLWRKNQEEYLRSLVKEGFKVMIISVQAYGLSPSILGKTLDENLVEDIIRRAKIYGFNPAFEGGEAETLVLDAPLFRKKLRVKGKVVKIGPDHYAYVINEASLEDKDVF